MHLFLFVNSMSCAQMAEIDRRKAQSFAVLCELFCAQVCARKSRVVSFACSYICLCSWIECRVPKWLKQIAEKHRCVLAGLVCVFACVCTCVSVSFSVFCPSVSLCFSPSRSARSLSFFLSLSLTLFISVSLALPPSVYFCLSPPPSLPFSPSLPPSLPLSLFLHMCLYVYSCPVHERLSLVYVHKDPFQRSLSAKSVATAPHRVDACKSCWHLSIRLFCIHVHVFFSLFAYTEVFLRGDYAYRGLFWRSLSAESVARAPDIVDVCGSLYTCTRHTLKETHSKRHTQRDTHKETHSKRPLNTRTRDILLQETL